MPEDEDLEYIVIDDIDAFWYASTGFDANAAQMALGQESAFGALLFRRMQFFSFPQYFHLIAARL